MKRIIIFLIIIVAILLISYVAYENGFTPTSNNNVSKGNIINIVGEQISNISKNEITNSNTENDTNNNEEEEEYIGKEEQESQKNEEDEEKVEKNEAGKSDNQELTGEEKAVDIVTKEYALSGETVRFDHMESGDYIVKINNGTAITWYIVDGETWEAQEY